MKTPLVSATRLSKIFSTGHRRVAALDDVSFSVERGKTLGLVGPSGSGKSTLARVLLRLVEPDSGTVQFDGSDLLAQKGEQLRNTRRRIQMVFQDPLAAFNPLATVGSALADPLRIHGLVDTQQRPAAIAKLLERVGLDPAFAKRSIHEISGGQRQRVAIARAIATNPDLVVLDEPVSALDVSIRARILRLLADLQRERGMAYIFISHDLAVVRAISHRVAILDAGRVVEEGPASDVVGHPQSPTGRALVAAVPHLQGNA